MEQRAEVLILGGGAAGYFAGLEFLRLRPGCRVVLLEAASRTLSKVKISGGGRCNVTHACFDVARLLSHYPRGHREMRRVFQRFGPRDTIEWFQSRGVPLKTESDGRMFPVSNSSQTIVDCLTDEARRLGLEVVTGWAVKEFQREPGEGDFLASGPRGVWRAPRVVLATGGSPLTYPWLQALGHQMVPSVPSLFTFTLEDGRLQGLAGVSPQHEVVARLELDPPVSQRGALLITHWGLSGPVILRLSAWGARPLAARGYRAGLRIDWLPDRSQEELREYFLACKRERPRVSLSSQPLTGLPRRLWKRLLGEAVERPAGELSDRILGRWAEDLKRCHFEVEGKGVFKEEFVVAGGVPLAEVDLKTMESRKVAGLYVVGELLDVDGLTGGFNFQNAWSTGWLAGGSLARAGNSPP